MSWIAGTYPLAIKHGWSITIWFDDLLGYESPFSFRFSQLAMFGSGLIQGTKIHFGFAGDSGPPNSKVVSPCTQEIQV